MLDVLTALASNEQLHYGPPPWWPIFPLLWLLVITAIVVIAIRIGRRRGGCGYGRARGGLDHLAERYAAGEIDETEYRNRRSVLEEEFQKRR